MGLPVVWCLIPHENLGNQKREDRNVERERGWSPELISLESVFILPLKRYDWRKSTSHSMDYNKIPETLTTNTQIYGVQRVAVPSRTTHCNGRWSPYTPTPTCVKTQWNINSFQSNSNKTIQRQKKKRETHILELSNRQLFLVGSRPPPRKRWQIQFTANHPYHLFYRSSSITLGNLKSRHPTRLPSRKWNLPHTYHSGNSKN
jgi:hypothetical protein